MLSIIICSVSSLRLQEVQQSIQSTIGSNYAYEIIAVDNRERNWPIAKVYNYAAQQANFPYLFFVHEDVKFHSLDWGNFIEKKLSETDCGLIGFAGSKVKLSSYSGWTQAEAFDIMHYYQRLDNKLSIFGVLGVYLQHPFEEVTVVDGFAMFVRKDVWVENKFDEQILTGFHCYDLDFSMQIARKYKNYVCCSNVLIEHFSNGVFDAKWFAETIRLHVNKWNRFLPMKTDDVKLTKKHLAISEEKIAYHFLFKLLRSDSSICVKKKVLLEFWSRPFSWKHLTRCLSCTLKYIRTI